MGPLVVTGTPSLPTWWTPATVTAGWPTDHDDRHRCVSGLVRWSRQKRATANKSANHLVTICRRETDAVSVSCCSQSLKDAHRVSKLGFR